MPPRGIVHIEALDGAGAYWIDRAKRRLKAWDGLRWCATALPSLCLDRIHLRPATSEQTDWLCVWCAPTVTLTFD